MDPNAANQWASLAKEVLLNGKDFNIERKSNVITADKRSYFSDYMGMDFGSVYRLNTDNTFNPAGPIQVFRMDAPVTKYDYCGSPGSITYGQMIQDATTDDTVKCIVIWADSPGGQADGTELLANIVKEATKVKPVIAFATGYACSAMYWIISSCSHIIVDNSNNGSMVRIGSIGTLNMWEDDAKQAESNGIVRHFVFASKSTDKWGDMRKANAGDYSEMKVRLDLLNDSFLNAVTENRSDKLNLKVENVLTGKVYNGNEAIANGLADALGSWHSTIEYASKLIPISKSKTQTNTMENNIAPFNEVLQAANSESFKIVDGGFLLTETQLKSINDAIVAQQASFDDVQKQLQVATEKQTDLVTQHQTEVEALNTEITFLNGKVKQLEQAPPTGFSGTSGDNDPPQGGSPDAEDLDAMAHNQMVDEMLAI
jgi:ClpP class serine protease